MLWAEAKQQRTMQAVVECHWGRSLVLLHSLVEEGTSSPGDMDLCISVLLVHKEPDLICHAIVITNEADTGRP